jgi:hypothetical protein
MGTPCAVVFAVICFLTTERHILAKYAHRLAYYKRCIDSILGIWLTQGNTNNNEDEEWLDFKNDLNKLERLKLTVSELTFQTVFLNLNITLDPTNGHFNFRTYQKTMNLHLYIPGGSTHPEGRQKITITGNLQRYWKQNTKEEEFINIASEFTTHLTKRGHNITTIAAISEEAGSNIERGPTPYRKPTRNDMDTTPLFFHTQYHPKGIPWKAIREIYNKTLAKNGFDSFTIAFSGPKNLRDKLCASKLREVDGLESTSEIVKRMRNAKHGTSTEPNTPTW